VISTLWPVPDAAAFLFSTALHQRMIVDGTEPLDAFGATKAWLRTSNRTEFARFASRLSASGLIGAADVDLVMAAIDAHGGEKPFAHPHVWANFVYWGV
jgi:CHAT domain-containing protein